MSCLLMVWALRQRGLSASERVVLIYLADKANGSLFCWPSIETICEATELSDKTVRRAVRRLAELRLIRIEARRRHTHHYHILRPTNGLDGDPLQPQVGEQEAVERSELPPNAYIPLVPHIQTRVERSDLPVKTAAQPPDSRSELPPNPKVDRSFLAPYPPKKESPKEERGSRASARPLAPLPFDWQPSVDLQEAGLRLGLTVPGIDRAAGRFRRWAAAGNVRLADWDARFENWLDDDAAKPWQQGPSVKPDRLAVAKRLIAATPGWNA